MGRGAPRRRGQRGAAFLGRRALLALLLGALGCASVTVAQEREAGDALAREVQAQLRVVRDPVVVDYVQRLGEEVAQAAGPQPFPLRFHVVEADEVNAFALPGGHIFVHTGTVLAARDASQLAGVLAHEVGHVVERHVAKNWERRRTAGIVQKASVLTAGLALGPGGAGAANLLGGLSTLAVLNSFDRDAEREADAFAALALPPAGYDPSGMVAFFEALAAGGEAAGSGFLSSHPATEERIRDARRRVGALPSREGLRADDGGRLEIIQWRIRLLTGRDALRPASPAETPRGAGSRDARPEQR